VNHDFKPFTSVPGASRLAAIPSPWLLATLPALLALMFGAASLEGTVGSFRDARPLDDIRLALGVHGTGSPPHFALLRDFLTLWLVGAIALTATLIHRQWQLMSVCVRDLELGGAIVARRDRRPSTLLEMGDRLFPRGKQGDHDALETVIRQAGECIASLRSRAGWIILVALVCSAIVMVGERTALFSEFVPPSSLADGRSSAWLHNAYNSWWASFNHPVGALVYLAVATLGIYLVVMQNAIGFVCAYFVLTLPKVATMDADWLNRDGLYGWRPIALVFRTVYWSLLLHGVTLALIVVTLGPAHVLAIVPLLLIWLIATPIYIGNSILAFRRVEREARRSRLRSLETEMTDLGITAKSPLSMLMPYLFEIDRVACAKIRPLSLGWARESVVFSAFILPLILTAVQLAAA
jgi:hypothetical protein